jgi:hypothetical protein
MRHTTYSSLDVTFVIPYPGAAAITFGDCLSFKLRKHIKSLHS